MRSETRTGFGESPQEDEALVVCARNGSDAAFETLVKRYEKRLFNYMLRMVGSAADAEDLFQETFIRVYTHLNRFRSDGAFRPWVYRIATNVCRDHLRRRKRRPQVPLETAASDERRSILDSTASTAANPREAAQESELAVRLAKAIANLHVRHRSVFLMARYEGLSYEEIGQALSIPIGTVKSRMNKAVKTLMEELEEPVK